MKPSESSVFLYLIYRFFFVGAMDASIDRLERRGWRFYVLARSYKGMKKSTKVTTCLLSHHLNGAGSYLHTQVIHAQALHYIGCYSAAFGSDALTSPASMACCASRFFSFLISVRIPLRSNVSVNVSCFTGSCPSSWRKT